MWGRKLSFFEKRKGRGGGNSGTFLGKKRKRVNSLLAQR